VPTSKRTPRRSVREKSVGLVLYRQTPQGPVYLLLHYPGGHWDFPKGHVERGEREKQTAIRELREETGITDAEILGSFRDAVRYTFRRGSRRVNKVVVYYIARTACAGVLLSDEHRGSAWLGASEAAERLTFANSRRIILDADSLIRKT